MTRRPTDPAEVNVTGADAELKADSADRALFIARRIIQRAPFSVLSLSLSPSPPLSGQEAVHVWLGLEGASKGNDPMSLCKQE